MDYTKPSTRKLVEGFLLSRKTGCWKGESSIIKTKCGKGINKKSRSGENFRNHVSGVGYGFLVKMFRVIATRLTLVNYHGH